MQPGSNDARHVDALGDHEAIGEDQPRGAFERGLYGVLGEDVGHALVDADDDDGPLREHDGPKGSLCGGHAAPPAVGAGATCSVLVSSNSIMVPVARAKRYATPAESVWRTPARRTVST